MERLIILNRLLDKYESSKHLLSPGQSNRRVMLRIEKEELPEYQYQEATIRDNFNDAAIRLERDGLVSLEWCPGRPVLMLIILNVDQVSRGYVLLGRIHPRDLAQAVCAELAHSLSAVQTPWICAWRDDVTAQAQSGLTVPINCKNDPKLSHLKGLLQVMSAFDSLRGVSITMRSFSVRCFHDSKRFEREYRDEFLRIAQHYDEPFSSACDTLDLGTRDKLAYWGIYSRPELYELSGPCRILTKSGVIDIGAASPYGLALPSTVISSLRAFHLDAVRQITFIENKTNYDEYLLSEKASDELVIYHGGFLSPQKRKLIQCLSASLSQPIAVRFWADIDLGGFQMFEQLADIIPALVPMRMSGDEVSKYKEVGLPRNKSYLEAVYQALEAERFPLFQDSMQKILECGVTIEQESFLDLYD